MGSAMIIRNILISFSLILSGNVFAHAENKMEWFANTSDGVYTFSYGQAESDFLPIMFSCIKKSGILNVSIQNYEIEPAVSLKKSQITYYNSSGRIRVLLQTFHQRMV